MQTQELISVHEFCIHHQVENSFLYSLQQYGLIEVRTIEEKDFIYRERLAELEKLVRLHYDLDINLEGIEAIIFLLQKIQDLQNEVNFLKNKLSFFDEEINATEASFDE